MEAQSVLPPAVREGTTKADVGVHKETTRDVMEAQSVLPPAVREDTTKADVGVHKAGEQEKTIAEDEDHDMSMSSGLRQETMKDVMEAQSVLPPAVREGTTKADVGVHKAGEQEKTIAEDEDHIMSMSSGLRQETMKDVMEAQSVLPPAVREGTTKADVGVHKAGEQEKTIAEDEDHIMSMSSGLRQETMKDVMEAQSVLPPAVREGTTKADVGVHKAGEQEKTIAEDEDHIMSMSSGLRQTKNISDLSSQEIACESAKWSSTQGGFFSERDFEFGRALGKGRFGRVALARNRRTQHIVAIKVLSKSELSREKVEHQILREIDIQLHLRHQNILKLFAYFWNETDVFLILEYVSGGVLFEQIQSNSYLENQAAATYLYQVCDAIEFCHLKKVIHRDIKPENLLIGNHGEIKLADFGWSVKTSGEKRRTLCGTIDYLPPEMLLNRAHSSQVDVWSIGVLLYEMLVGKAPFGKNTVEQTVDGIRKGKFNFPPRLCSGAKNLITQLLQKDPKNRLPLKQVMTHYWVVSNMTGKQEKRQEKRTMRD